MRSTAINRDQGAINLRSGTPQRSVFLLPAWQYASRTIKTAAWVAFEGGNSPSRRLPSWSYARLPWPKTVFFTWKSPGFSCLLPACLALAAAACTSLACLPGLILAYCQAGRGGGVNAGRFFYLQEARDKKTTQQHDAGTGGSAPIGIGGCKPQGPRVVDRRAHRLFVRTTADSRGGGGGVVLLEHEACVQMLALFRNSHAPKRILM